METLAAAPELRDIEVSDSQPTPPAASSWIEFSGSSTESSGHFVRAIQRIAFQQGRVEDDRWIANYVSTCFDGDALVWYSELDEQTQGSWRNLRTALLRRYPPIAGKDARSPSGPAAPPASTGATAPNSAQTEGVIELVGLQAQALGYLSFDTATGAAMTLDKDQAIRVVIPTDPRPEILQLAMARSGSASVDDKFPYLGLGLYGGGDTVPAPLPGMTKTEYRNFDRNAPRRSSKCEGVDIWHPDDAFGYIATWILAACGESRSGALYKRRSDTTEPHQRGAAAVWKYNSNTEELTMTWAMDDGSECELGAYIPDNKHWSRLTPDDFKNFHLHRVTDVTPANVGKYISESRVRFAFHPEH